MRRMRTGRGRHRSLTPDLTQLIEGLELQNSLTTTAYAHRQVAAVASQHGWPISSYRCVYGVIKQLNLGLLTLAHRGMKAYQDWVRTS